MEGDRIMGDLKYIGYICVRGIRANICVDDDISNVAKICARGGISFSLEKNNKYQMKYKDKHPPRKLNKGDLKALRMIYKRR